MKKYLWFALIVLLLVIPMLACGGDEVLEDEDTAVEQPVAAATATPDSKGDTAQSSAGLIPGECLEDEAAFEACWEEGLIPEDCVDEEGYILDECLADAPVADDESAGDAEAVDSGTEAGAEEQEEASAGDDGASVAAQGVADSGFRPEVNGFSFENYGDEYGGLTAAELQRMFGDGVCTSLAGGKCTLSPPARQWLEQMNQYMAGGHCEGMAVLSSLMYYDQVNPQDFGGSVTHDLAIDNEALQREIAYWWVTQGTYPGGVQKVNESPTAVVNTLMEAFSQGKDAPEWWALGIYKSDMSGGHAITPFAVEDKGEGIYHIWVYDNNFPGDTRYVEVDTNADTWQYQASTNPNEPEELYDGDAELDNLEVVAISPRLGPQNCDFCGGDGSQARTTPGLAQAEPQYYQVWLSGKADLLIIDDQGRRIGYDNGKFVNEIPGASGEHFKFAAIEVWASDNEPVYRVPVGVSFEVLVDGSRLEEAESSAVSMIGPGYYLAVEDVWLEPGEIDSINVTTDESRHQLTYVTDYEESPMIELGIETDEADYIFLVQATEMIGAEDTFDVAVDPAEGDFIINTSYNTEPVTFDIYVMRIDDEGEHIFGSDDVVLQPENTVYFNYLEWIEDGSVMYADFDYENDGEIDESFELVDEAEFWLGEEE